MGRGVEQLNATAFWTGFADLGRTLGSKVAAMRGSGRGKVSGLARSVEGGDNLPVGLSFGGPCLDFAGILGLQGFGGTLPAGSVSSLGSSASACDRSWSGCSCCGFSGPPSIRRRLGVLSGVGGLESGLSFSARGVSVPKLSGVAFAFRCPTASSEIGDLGVLIDTEGEGRGELRRRRGGLFPCPTADSAAMESSCMSTLAMVGVTQRDRGEADWSPKLPARFLGLAGMHGDSGSRNGCWNKDSRSVCCKCIAFCRCISCRAVGDTIRTGGSDNARRGVEADCAERGRGVAAALFAECGRDLNSRMLPAQDLACGGASSD